MKMICPYRKKCIEEKGDMYHCEGVHEYRHSCRIECNFNVITGVVCIPYNLKHIMKEVLKKDNEE